MSWYHYLLITAGALAVSFVCGWITAQCIGFGEDS